MFFKILLIVVLSVLLSGSVFSQSDWVGVDSNNAPSAIKARYSKDWFRNTNTVEISQEHGNLFNSRQSLKITYISGNMQCGDCMFMKVFNPPIQIQSDTLFLNAEIKGFQNDDSVYQIRVHPFMLNNDSIFEADNSMWTDTSWTQEECGPFRKEYNYGLFPRTIDTLFFTINILVNDVSNPYGIYMDNIWYLDSNGEQVIIDSCGEDIAAEEPGKIKDLVSAFPNPFYDFCKFNAPANSLIEIYNLSGQKVKMIKNFSWNGRDENGKKLPRGMYFASFKIGDKTMVKKLVLI
ncbi:MAG: T9SS type A sorting domain-containing protein [Patescibacteria group bacterium]|nr:T9SS type A sorting domain-containing protein [Patescibacteria group bacterium]MDD5164822.1 T9SS type A sorting domain-containing protein [Patescibacteria group bacterium]MDD5534452.1 T9SS type A sorting domain-containing protein [Patescibacteria group bacterium]